MRTGAILLTTLFLAGALVGLPHVDEDGTVGLHTYWLQTVRAQNNTTPIPPVPEAPSNPVQSGYDSTTGVIIETRRTFARVGEGDYVVMPVDFVDNSVQSTQYATAPASITCEIEHQTPNATGWQAQIATVPPLYRHDRTTGEFALATLMRPSPEFFEARIGCTAGSPYNGYIGNFTLRGQAEEYSYVSMSPATIFSAPVRPNQEVTFSYTITNGGSHPKVFLGRVEAPDTWTFPQPASVYLEPGETKTVNLTGLSPRDRIVYISESPSVRVFYAPQGFPGKEQLVFFSVAVQGVYMHPAILPFLLIAATIIVILVYLAVLAKRQIEEQILGKPAPPWRIPEEIAMLEQLQKDDPDQYYVVRHYLMPEEYKSALLWYEAYKKATKSDRKAETKWFKLKRKQETKAEKLEKVPGRIERKYARKIRVGEWFREQKINKLERLNRRKTRKEQRGFDKKRSKKVRKIERKHRKKVKKMTKRYEKRFNRDVQRIERKNRKLEKKGLEPLALPDYEPPGFDEPELPEEQMVQEVPLMASRYAKRAERVHRRFDKKKARREAARDRKLARVGARIERKKAKILAKIPPEPKTDLYHVDDYVPEEEIIVEDDRSPLAKVLQIPTLEERERARRAKARYTARRQGLVEAGDDEALARLDEQFIAAKTERREARKATVAGRKEADLMAKQDRKALKERARELVREAKVEAGTAKADRKSADVASRIQAKHAKARDTDAAGADESAPETTSGRGGFRVGFRKKAKQADTEPDAAEQPKEEAATARASGDEAGRQE